MLFKAYGNARALWEHPVSGFSVSLPFGAFCGFFSVPLSVSFGSSFSVFMLLAFTDTFRSLLFLKSFANDKCSVFPFSSSFRFRLSLLFTLSAVVLVSMLGSRSGDSCRRPSQDSLAELGRLFSSLPTSDLAQRVKQHFNEVERDRNLNTALRAAEVETTKRLLSLWPVMDWCSMSNCVYSPTAVAFLPRRADRRAYERLALRIAADHRSGCCLRCAMRVEANVRAFAVSSDLALFRARASTVSSGVAVWSEDAERNRVIEALQYITVHDPRWATKSFTEWQLSQKRTTLVKQANGEVMKSLVTASRSLILAVAHLSALHRAGREKQTTEQSSVPREVPGDESTEDPERLGEEYWQDLNSRVSTFAASLRPSEVLLRGTDAAPLIVELNKPQPITTGLQNSRNRFRVKMSDAEAQKDLNEPEKMVAARWEAALEASMNDFAKAVEMATTKLPQLGALNVVLDYYGVDASSDFLHQLACLDGAAKNEMGTAFEDRFWADQIIWLKKQVLAPYVAATGHLAYPVAERWVDWCLSDSRKEGDQPPSDFVQQCGVPELLAVLPRFTLYRNVDVIKEEETVTPPGEQATDGQQPPSLPATAKQAPKMTRIGELDGIVVDERDNAVLFIVEAKANPADLGRALTQREKIFRALDEVWLGPTRPGAPAPPAGKAPAKGSAKCPPLPVRSILRFEAQPSSSGAGVGKQHGGGKATFTADNFARAFFTPPTPAAPVRQASAPSVPQPQGASDSRAAHWVFVTTLPRGTDENPYPFLRSIPSTGETQHIIEGGIAAAYLAGVVRRSDELHASLPAEFMNNGSSAEQRDAIFTQWEKQRGCEGDSQLGGWNFERAIVDASVFLTTKPRLVPFHFPLTLPEKMTNDWFASPEAEDLARMRSILARLEPNTSEAIKAFGDLFGQLRARSGSLKAGGCTFRDVVDGLARINALRLLVIVEKCSILEE